MLFPPWRKGDNSLRELALAEPAMHFAGLLFQIELQVVVVVLEKPLRISIPYVLLVVSGNES